VKGELINMTQAWDKEKIGIPTANFWHSIIAWQLSQAVYLH